MAVRVIDLNNMKQCDVHEASVGIVFPGSCECIYYKKASSRRRRDGTATPQNYKDIEWSSSTKVSDVCSSSEYVELVDWWYECASEDDDYVSTIKSVYGSFPGWDMEVMKAFNWLKLNSNDKRRDIDRFVKSWMRRHYGV